MSFTSKYAMLKGKEGKELAKVRARARRGRTTARRLTLCPRACRSPPLCTEPHLRRAPPDHRRQEREGPGGARRVPVPRCASGLVLPVVYRAQIALFKNKITALKDRKKVHGKKSWV